MRRASVRVVEVKRVSQESTKSGQTRQADHYGEEGLENDTQERESRLLSDLPFAVRILYAPQLGCARRRCAARYASFQSRNQTPLSTGDGGASAAKSREGQRASVWQGQGITFL